MQDDTWKLLRFGEICKVQSGFAFKSSDFIHDPEKGVAVIRMNNLKAGEIVFEDAVYIPIEKLKNLKAFEIKTGDFLFGMSGSLDNFAVAKDSDTPSYLNQRVGRLIPTKCTTKFAKHLFQSETIRSGIRKFAAGNAQLNISPRQIESIKVLVPLPAEQELIAQILDAADTAIKRTKEAIKQTRQLKDSVLQEFLFEALGETAYADHPAKELPSGWNLIPTEDLLEIEPKNGVSPEAKTQPPGIPTFSIAAIRNGVVDLDATEHRKYAQISEKKAKPYEVDYGDVLIVRGNANPNLVGKAGIIRSFPEGCIYPDITKRVVFKDTGENCVSPEYAVLVWNHSVVHNQILRRAKTSNGTLKINNRDVKQIVMPVAPRKEQDQLVSLVQAVDKKYWR